MKTAAQVVIALLLAASAVGWAIARRLKSAAVLSTHAPSDRTAHRNGSGWRSAMISPTTVSSARILGLRSST